MCTCVCASVCVCSKMCVDKKKKSNLQYSSTNLHKIYYGVFNFFHTKRNELHREFAKQIQTKYFSCMYYKTESIAKELKASTYDSVFVTYIPCITSAYNSAPCVSQYDAANKRRCCSYYY